jgi:glutamyl-tRNA reductase
MPILGLGVSYRRADVELLERLAFVEEDLPKAYRRLLDEAAVSEAAILSTCNRVEVYAEVGSYHSGFLALKRFLAESREVAPEEFAEPLYAHYEEDAAEHLFDVAAGIDSMVLGEPQILTQVRRAHRHAETEGAMGPTLSALFRGAIRAGRRARAETAIGASPGALVEAGLDLASARLGGLSGRSALVIGAGGMATLALRQLRERGIGHLRVLNRSVDRARRLAAGADADSGGLELLVSALGHADLVVSSTAAPRLVVGREAVHEAMATESRRPPGRSLFLLDLAVPRDVEPDVAVVPGVSLADIDDLRQAVQRPGEEGAGREVERVRAIVEEEVGRLTAWRRAARLAPLIRGLRELGDEVRAAELVRLAAPLSGLSHREREAVEALAQGIVAKLLHGPIVRLKETSGPGGNEALARALAELFGIPFRPDA